MRPALLASGRFTHHKGERMTDNTSKAFAAGWEYGYKVGRCSPREAEFSLRALNIEPSAGNIDAFCNGADDGSAGDDGRLNATKAGA